jgi:uncharacterized repeat protein (TIGR04042 family)
MRRLLDSFDVRKANRLRGLSPMPEVLFTVQFPNGETRECYSPSSVVRRYFGPGEEMPAAEFLARSRRAYAEASERVRAKFGFGCGQAATQLAAIEKWVGNCPGDGVVRIVSI